jgi:hypothetical protein
MTNAPAVFFVNDKAGKPVGINMVIGQRPQAAFGNSDGDQQMLEWTTAGAGARLGMLVLHDDAQREFAYGPAAGLPESKRRGRFTQSPVRRGQGQRLDGHQHQEGLEAGLWI